MIFALAKVFAIAAIAVPLAAAGTATATFHCALNHGGVAIFRLHEGKIEGFGHLHKPSGGHMVLHLGATPCVSPAGCLAAAQVPGHKGWKLDTIVEVGTAPHLVMHKCR